MSLYYDAATILADSSQSGSLKSRIYSTANQNLKSKPAHIFALISECAKYDTFLKEVIDNVGLLDHEPKLTPILALLLVHDHFFAKGGIAASSGHVLKQAVERHKARLQAEFTKSRLRRRCGTIDALKSALNDKKAAKGIRLQPRWVRVNKLKSSLKKILDETLSGYVTTQDLSAITHAGPKDKLLYIDPTIPELIALPPDVSIVHSKAYASGEIILQDKASCFPAYLLVDASTSTAPEVGDVLDGCAAPGNKTTHVASILATQVGSRSGRKRRTVFACERDTTRSKTLQSMVTKSEAGSVTILAKQDFLALDPHDQRFAGVTHLLLDPSCSGSGILRREDVPNFALPIDSRQKHVPKGDADKSNSKKRKRDSISSNGSGVKSITQPDLVDAEVEEVRGQAPDKARLEKLSSLQSKIVEHALAFPGAVRVSYSTCSIHVEENEAVVARVLRSSIANQRGWRLLRREEQVEGMRKWKHRGVRTSSLPEEAVLGNATSGMASLQLNEQDLEACIRCSPTDDEGTMGFFVSCFTREGANRSPSAPGRRVGKRDVDEWEGFSDQG